MDTLNRVLLALIAIIILAVSLTSALLALGVVTPSQVNSIIPYLRIINLFQVNLATTGLASILLLIVVLVLSVLWFRGQFLGIVKPVVGGRYEIKEKGPGFTTVSYDVLGRAMDFAISKVQGVVGSKTQIYSEREGRVFAHSSLMVRRDAKISDIDKKIRSLVNQEWLDKFGIAKMRHDITINLEPTERRVV
ncbi:MAG: hypothetical protein QME63_02360 [Actinomycetota bacterium]|nr:hypothetical protein [Actinomycetota bacterium]